TPVVWLSSFIVSIVCVIARHRCCIQGTWCERSERCAMTRMAAEDQPATDARQTFMHTVQAITAVSSGVWVLDWSANEPSAIVADCKARFRLEEGHVYRYVRCVRMPLDVR